MLFQGVFIMLYILLDDIRCVHIHLTHSLIKREKEESKRSTWRSGEFIFLTSRWKSPPRVCSSPPGLRDHAHLAPVLVQVHVLQLRGVQEDPPLTTRPVAVTGVPSCPGANERGSVLDGSSQRCAQLQVDTKKRKACSAWKSA